MLKIAEIALIISLALLMTLAVVLSGCTSSENSNPQQDAIATGTGNPGASQDLYVAGNGNSPNSAPVFDANRTGFRGGNRSNFGNLSAEQRQQMMERRVQQAISSCTGKSEGSSCTFENQRGNATGTCTTRNESLACSFGNRSGQYPSRILGN